MKIRIASRKHNEDTLKYFSLVDIGIIENLRVSEPSETKELFWQNASNLVKAAQKFLEVCERVSEQAFVFQETDFFQRVAL